MSKFNQGNTKASKLTGVEVMEIREKYASGVYSMARLSREYHVTPNTISSIVNGLTWQDLPSVTPQHVVDEAALRSQRKLEAMLAQTDGLPPATVVADDDLGLPPDFVATLAQKEMPVDPSVAARAAAYLGKPPTERGGGLATHTSAQSKPAVQAPSAPEGAGEGGREALAALGGDDAPTATERGDDAG